MKFWKNLSVGKKLAAGFTGVVLLFILSVIISLGEFGNMKEGQDQLESRYQQMMKLEELELRNSGLMRLCMDIIVDKDKGEVSQERLKELSSLEKEIKDSENEMMNALDTEEERKNGVEITEHFKEIFAAVKEKLIPAVSRKESDQAFWDKIDDEIDSLGIHVDEHINTIIKSIKAEVQEAREKADSIEKNVRFLILAILVVGVILSFLVAFFTSRAISRPLKEAVEMLKDIAEGEGNLTRRLQGSGKDEIGQLAHWFNRFIEKLQGMIKSIKEITDGVSSGVLQISSSAEEMASTAEEQSSQSQSVSSAMTELTATSDDISKSIESTRSTAEESSQMTKDGGKTIQKSIDALKSIEGQTQNLGNIIGKLGDSTKEIGNIIDVINDVADQTNLLALNAAIEAARAGDAGRGFAVVADEVRKLAERTAKATKEIEAIITQLQQEADNADTAMSSAAKEVDNGTLLGQESLEILNKIVLSSDNIFNSAISVASAVTQENATIEEVNNNIQGIAAASEESANAIQEVAATTDDLAKQSEKLKQMVDQFTV